VIRSPAGWSIVDGVASPVDDVDFPMMTGGAGGVVRFFSVGTYPSTAAYRVL